MINKQDNIKVKKPSISETLVFPQLLPQVVVSGIRQRTLPGITVVSKDLSKPQPFPYGEIMVEHNPEEGKTISYPTTNSSFGELVMRTIANREADKAKNLMLKQQLSKEADQATLNSFNRYLTTLENNMKK